MAGTLGLLIPLCSQRAPLGNSLLPLAGTFGVQGRTDISLERGVGSDKAAARCGRAVRGCSSAETWLHGPSSSIHGAPAAQGTCCPSRRAAPCSVCCTCPAFPAIPRWRWNAFCLGGMVWAAFGQGDAVRASLPVHAPLAHRLPLNTTPISPFLLFFPFTHMHALTSTCWSAAQAERNFTPLPASLMEACRLSKETWGWAPCRIFIQWMNENSANFTFLPAWDGATWEYSTFCMGTGHLLRLLFSQNASSRPAQYKQGAVDLGSWRRDYVKPGRFAGLDIYGLTRFCFGCRGDVRGAHSAVCRALKRGRLSLPACHCGCREAQRSPWPPGKLAVWGKLCREFVILLCFFLKFF